MESEIQKSFIEEAQQFNVWQRGLIGAFQRKVSDLKDKIKQINWQLSEKETAANHPGKSGALELAKKELQAQLREAKQRLNDARDASNRFNRYHPEDDGDAQCPACWMYHQRRSKAFLIPGDDDRIDKFCCQTCGHIIPVTVTGRSLEPDD